MTPTCLSWAWRSSHALASLVVVLALAAQGRAEDEDTTQRFSVTPESVEVKEGDDVFLRCIVVNQQGNAQWTKDGFALGFERHVPGYPRYRYAGDPSKGEHHLVIKGATLQDDGEYQCQVGPTISIKPIWASANVTVMVSPTSISVVGKEDGASVEVKAGTTVTLECLVTDARPAASVMWYRDGLMLDQDLHEEQLEPSAKARRWSVRSKLLLRPTPADNGQQYSCRALHPALKDSPTSLVASVILSVLHPPSAPAITGYAAGDVLLEGQRRNLTCRVLGGNPRPWVLWYRHGRPLDHASINQVHRADATVSTKAPISNVREPGGVSSSQQVTGSRQEDGAEYECRVTSPLLQAPLSTRVALAVHYGPKGVDVTGPSVVAAGQEFVVVCRSFPSNPPATITWLVQGERTPAGPPVITEDEGGGWVTTSRLTHYLTRMRKMSEATVECRAHNPDGEGDVSRKHVITIIKRPGTPVVEVVEAEGAVVAGNTLGVVCTTDGGNPPPNITMYKGNEKLPIKVIHEGTMTKAGTEFKVTAADNEAEVKCDVTSLATKKPMSAFTTIHLLFPAWEVSGWVSPSTVEEDQQVTLTCETSSSLPPSNITWHSRGVTLEGAVTKHTPGVFGGTVTRSELVLKPKAEDNEKVFVCEADNDLGVIVTANVTLNVLHEPVWVTTPAQTVEVEEGDDLLLLALAAANPGPVSYSWWRGPSVIEDMGVKGGADGRLILSNIDRQQSGNYSVTAHTSSTDITAYFSVVVQYGPEEIVAAERVVVDEDKTTSILCHADGNPTPNVTWTRDNNNNNNNNIYINSSGAVLASGIGEAKLLVEHASKADTGLYLCHASNSVASAAPVYTALVVTQAPTPTGPSLETGEAGKSWAAVGASGRFDCRVRTAPEPQFRWTVNERELQNSRKYSIHIPQLVDGVVEWSSVLEVRSVTIRDYGVYTCTAANGKGAHAANFTLSPPVLPGPPLDVNVTVVSGNSALISWSHNRMGAPATGFTVKYQASGSPDYMTQDIEGGNRSSMVVEGLTPGREFSFSVQASNEQGRSPFSQPPAAVTMIDVLEEVARGSTHGSQPRMPRLMLLLISLTGTALLVLNISIIVCFLRRRALNRSMSASSSKSTAFEVYTPATTPGPPAPDEHLPLTSANEAPPPDYHQVECQTRVDECPGGALASLAPELEAAPPLLPPPLASSSPRPKSASPLLNGGVRVQSDRFLFDDKDSLARADAFLPQGDASSRKGSYGLAAPDALPHADGRGLGADRMPRQEMSIYALPPEFSPQMGAKALGEFPPAGLALSRPDVCPRGSGSGEALLRPQQPPNPPPQPLHLHPPPHQQQQLPADCYLEFPEEDRVSLASHHSAESYALPRGAALLQAPRPLCHPAKPAPQVIYHGQPHLQQQLEQQSQEHSLGARCQCGHEQQPLQTCLQLSSSYSSLNPARLAAHDACFDDSCHQTLDLPGGCSSLGPGRSCLKSPQRTCTLQRSHSAHEPYVCVSRPSSSAGGGVGGGGGGGEGGGGGAGGTASQPPGGPPAQAKAEACSLCGNAGGGAPPPYHNPRNCVSNVCFMYGSSGFQTVF